MSVKFEEIDTYRPFSDVPQGGRFRVGDCIYMKTCNITTDTDFEINSVMVDVIYQSDQHKVGHTESFSGGFRVSPVSYDAVYRYVKLHAADSI